MKVKSLFLVPIKAYQYLSRMLPGSCRYYPTCSEYAKWKFELDRPDRALFSTILRILRCNQLFEGGIDYPLIRYTPPRLLSLDNPVYRKKEEGSDRHSPNLPDSKIAIKYWIVPAKGDLYYIVKEFDE